MANENLLETTEQVREKVFHNTTNFIVDWLQETANRSTISEIKIHLRKHVDLIRNLHASGNARIQRENYMSNHPEDAHIIESMRFDG